MIINGKIHCLRPEERTQTPQVPAGAHLGGANPPEPAGMPPGLTFPADISFLIFLPRHCGQLRG